MSNKFEKSILDARKRHSIKLEIEGVHSESLPSEIFSLVWLEEITIYRSTWISDLKGDWENLTKLRILNIDGGDNSKIWNGNPLAALTNLRELGIKNTNISDIGFIKRLKKLTSLDLSYTSVRDIDHLKHLTNQIQNLNLEGTSVKFPDFFSKMTNLERLNLSHTNFDNTKTLENMTKIHELNLDSTPVTDTQPLVKMAHNHKIHINLNNTPIKDTRPLKGLEKNGLILSFKKTYMGRNNREITFKNCPLIYLPEEELKNEPLTHYSEIDNKTRGIFNEAKIIIVGEPRAGKTTLMKKITNPDYRIPQDEEPTHGIQINEGWKFYHQTKLDQYFLGNFWDFGGQEIQYMTHQFFLTAGAVYILVSADDRQESMENFPYWFKVINLLGYKAGEYTPVIVVQNEITEEFSQLFDLSKYREQYPELEISHHQLNLKNDDFAFDHLIDQIKRKLMNLSHVNDKRPTNWSSIRHNLKELSSIINHINYEEFSQVCKNYDVNEEETQTLFSRYLHKLGSILHFIDDPLLNDFIILNPQWAVNAVYIVLDDKKIIRNNGKFTYKDIKILWKKSLPFKNVENYLHL